MEQEREVDEKCASVPPRGEQPQRVGVLDRTAGAVGAGGEADDRIAVPPDPTPRDRQVEASPPRRALVPKLEILELGCIRECGARERGTGLDRIAHVRVVERRVILGVEGFRHTVEVACVVRDTFSNVEIRAIVGLALAELQVGVIVVGTHSTIEVGRLVVVASSAIEVGVIVAGGFEIEVEARASCEGAGAGNTDEDAPRWARDLGTLGAGRRQDQDGQRDDDQPCEPPSRAVA
jgi:hypothetical protein